MKRILLGLFILTMLLCAGMAAAVDVDPTARGMAATALGLIGNAGNTVTFAAASANTTLPVDGSATTISLVTDSVYNVDVWVSAKLVASSEAALWKFSLPVCTNNNAPFVFGSRGASATWVHTWGNAMNRYGCNVVVSAPGFTVVASGPIYSVWGVTKVEVRKL